MADCTAMVSLADAMGMHAESWKSVRTMTQYGFPVVLVGKKQRIQNLTFHQIKRLSSEDV